MHHLAAFFQHPSLFLFSAISSPHLSQLSAYRVFVLAENSHFVSRGNCVFLCSSRLLLLSCMFSTLAKLLLPACSRECAPSHKGPYGVMLQSLHPEGSSLYLPLSLWMFFSLFLYMPLFFPAVPDCFIPFSLTLLF